jgi:hypothetical protein
MTAYRKGTIGTADFLFDPQSGALLVTVANAGALSASGTCTPAVAGTPVQLVSAWATATAYVPGNTRLDTDSTTWVCLVAHTSGSGTFSADRAAHPTYWQQIAACRFVWVGAPVDVNDAPINTRMAMIGGSSRAGEPNMPLCISNYEGFTVATKAGWDYLWVRSVPDVNAILQPEAAYVVKVYQSIDFATLGIGT